MVRHRLITNRFRTQLLNYANKNANRSPKRVGIDLLDLKLGGEYIDKISYLTHIRFILMHVKFNQKSLISLITFFIKIKLQR